MPPKSRAACAFLTAPIAAALAALLALAPTAPCQAQIFIDLDEESIPAFLGVHAEDQFGYSTAAGDFDADGEIELAVSAPGARIGEGTARPGVVYLIERDAIARLTSERAAADVATISLEGVTDRAGFGTTLAVGDLTGDGVDDLVIGAPGADDGGRIAAGRIYVLAGGDPSRWASDVRRSTAPVLAGEASGQRLGSSLLIRDIDGDGTNELLASAFRAGLGEEWSVGKVIVFRFGSQGEETDGEPADTTSAAAAVPSSRWTAIEGGRSGDALRGLAAGDIDGDGRLELIVGAPHADGSGDDRTDAGAVYVVPAERVVPDVTLALPDAATSTLLGPIGYSCLGRSIQTGDIDVDGVDDLLVSAYASRRDGIEVEASGEVFVLFGGADGLGEVLDLAGGDVTEFHGRKRWSLFGLPVLLADINSDASADILIAAQYAGSPDGSREACGEVYVYRGSLESVVQAKSGGPDTADITIIGAEKGDHLGGSLLVADVAGGRMPDLVIGAPEAYGRPDAPRMGKLYVIEGEHLSR